MKELKNHLKVDMESPALGMIVGSSTVNYQDVPVSDFRICDRLRESISSFFEKDEEPYRSMIQQSKSEWKDACHKRSIGDVETLLNTHIRPDYHFNPLNSSTETYHEISPSITSEATLSPNKLESMITIASQEAEKQEVDMNTRADTTPSSVHASVLASNRCHWNDGREKYTSNLKSVVSKVVDDQSHLSSEKWSSQGNLLPCVYPMKLNNKGGETYNRSTREHFGSMDVPPTVQFWRSKGDSVRDGTENETFLPNGDDLEIRMKLAKINSIASESKRSEWNV
ncbi:uncharacterized protein L199_005600 [Kwoniella botswanensis]|uniref:uncharacterized protein n=1 Tax=Kwoniella botswanensis TaxID=1268659 RepID=UPI00315DFE17